MRAVSHDSSFERARAQFAAGNAAFEAGQLQEAERCYRESLAALPGRASTTANLGRLLLQQGRHGEARALLEPVALAVGSDVELWSLLALAEEAQGDAALALGWLDRAIALEPGQAGLHCRRGRVLHRMMRMDDALQAWERATQLDASMVQAWADRGTLLAELGQPLQALQHFERALQAGADPQMLNFQMAAARTALAGTPASASFGADRPTPASPPPQYVRGLFDGYAGDFDEHVTKALQYQAPQVLARGLLRLGHAWFGHALDLGCGTGLCAGPLSPLVGQLDGVDLSPAMLARARATGRYTQLHEADLLEHLQTTPTRHDLVVSADVFIYVGALEGVFAGVKRVLRPQGLFCFSVEQAEDSHDWQLQASLRYAHSERHLRELAQAHGLSVLALQPQPLRRDARHEVRGLYGWLQAQAA